MPTSDPSYKNYRHHTADSPPSVPTGKKDDPMPTPGAKRDPAGLPPADPTPEPWSGADTPKQGLRVKNLVKGMYHKSGGPREPS